MTTRSRPWCCASTARGGSALASEQIYREVLALKAAGKPVVVSMGDVAASGGYYIAAPADRDLRERRRPSPDRSASLRRFRRSIARSRKLGVTVDGVGTTALSGKLRVDRPLRSGAARLPAADDRTRLRTVPRACGRRGAARTRDEVHEIAQGRVWIGEDAHASGWSIELGTYDDAVERGRPRLQICRTTTASTASSRSCPGPSSWRSQLRMKAARLSGSLLGPATGLAAQRSWHRLSAAQTNIARLRDARGQPRAAGLLLLLGGVATP